MRLIALIFFLFVCRISAQNSVEFSLQQDVKLFVLGDDKGNNPLTINLLSKLEVPVYCF